MKQFKLIREYDDLHVLNYGLQHGGGIKILKLCPQVIYLEFFGTIHRPASSLVSYHLAEPGDVPYP